MWTNSDPQPKHISLKFHDIIKTLTGGVRSLERVDEGVGTLYKKEAFNLLVRHIFDLFYIIRYECKLTLNRINFYSNMKHICPAEEDHQFPLWPHSSSCLVNSSN